MEIPDIKKQLNIIEVAEHYGHTPNRNHLIKCPFHEDDKPSLQLYPKTNTWHCFGCNKGTDQIDFIQLKENCTTHQAINKAKELLQHIPTKTTKPMNTAPTKEIPQEQRIKALTTCFTYFARSIASTEKAKQYLQSRSLDPQKITTGYDGHNFHKSKEATEKLKKLYISTGLIYPDKLGRKDNYHSFFDGCIVFPTYNEKGEIVNLYGRNIDENKESKHHYLPGKHQGIYPKYPKPETENLIITECIIDAATLLQNSEIAGKYELMSCYGTNNFTAEHQNAIKNLPQLKEVIFFFDGDKAGREAVIQHAEKIKTINPKIKISCIETPENEDINSLAQGHSSEIFIELISNRKLFLSEGKQGKEIFSNISDERKNAESLVTSANPDLRYGTGQLISASTNLNTDNPEQLIFETNEVTITLQGGMELHNLKRLRATLHMQLKANVYKDYRDTIDLYSNSGRKRLIQEVSEELEISSRQVKETITELTNQLENYRHQRKEAERKRTEAQKQKDTETFTTEQLQSGEKLLQSKDLMNQTYNRIKQIGLIGQEKNGLLLFFIYLTRMTKEPLHALVQGKSGSGKTYLLKKIVGLLPKIHYKCLTAITENSLYYGLQGKLKNMLLLLEDLEGMYNALLPIRELMTNLFISKWTTITNPRTGEPEQKDLHIEGPVCVAGATTEDRIYEDNANRSFQIQIEESKGQEEKVLEYQRKEAAGILDKTIEEKIQTEFKAAQLQLAKNIEVVIPFSEELRIPEFVFKKQRTNKHYLLLIKIIAFWHQKQREIKTDKYGKRYIEATIEDVRWANYLCREALLRKSDELSPQLRNFFESLKNYLTNNKTKQFYARDIQRVFRLYPMKLNRQLKELTDRGLIKQTGGNYRTSYEYEVAVWNDYKELQKGMELLDEIYERIKNKYSKKSIGITEKSLA